MLRHTKLFLQSSLLFLAIFLLLPSANAQLPGAINNNLQVIAYQVGSMPAEPALYNPLNTNVIRVWGKNFVNLPTSVDVAVFFDSNNDGNFVVGEMIYSSGSPLTLPAASVNNGVNSIAGTTIVMPNLPPGNYDTRIVFYTPGSPLNPNGGLVRTRVTGTSSSDLTVAAFVQDDPNMNLASIPDDCPIDQMIEVQTTGTVGTTLNAVYSFRQLDLKAYDQTNINNNVPFTLVRHIVAIEPITLAPKVLPGPFILPESNFFASSQAGQQIDFDEHLTYIYWPVGYRVFQIFYYVLDQNGAPIQIINSNSQITGVPSYRSEDVELCEGENLQNENLDSEVFGDILSGNITIQYNNGGSGNDDEGEGGRKAFKQFQEESENGFIFPNPSKGMTYLQLELAEANKVSWQILNTNGQQVSARTIQSVKAGNYAISLDTEDLAPGIYVCQYSIDGQYYQKRFAKQ